MSKEELENLISSIKEKLDDTSKALVSEDLLSILSTYKDVLDQVEDLTDKLTKLETDNEELLKVNGRLFQKIGFEDKEEEKRNNDLEKDNDEVEEEIKIEDVVNEKGELIANA